MYRPTIQTVRSPEQALYDMLPVSEKLVMHNALAWWASLSINEMKAYRDTYVPQLCMGVLHRGRFTQYEIYKKVHGL